MTVVDRYAPYQVRGTGTEDRPVLPSTASSPRITANPVLVYIDELVAQPVSSPAEQASRGSRTSYRPLSEKLSRHSVVVSPKAVQLAQDRFISLQKWEGVVTAIDEQTFWAHLIDLTQGGADEEAELFVDDVTDDDRALLQIGAGFYWNIGYRDNAHNGNRIRASEIRFKRVPPVSAQEYDSALSRARHLSDLLDWK